MPSLRGVRERFQAHRPVFLTFVPIAKEFRHFYGRQWQEVTRPRILKRARNKCEECGKPNRQKVWVFSAFNRQFWRRTRKECWINCRTRALTLIAPPREQRRIRVVLTIAHLNHTPGDDRDENLKALCQWCHLHHDKEHHAETRAKRKDAARPLLQQMIA